MERDIRDDLFAHLLTMPPAFYHAHRVGDLMSRASSDVSAVRQLAGFGTVMMSGTTLAFVGTLTAMWLIDPWLTVYALTPFPLLVLIAKRFIHQVATRSTEVQEQLGVLSAKIQENLGGIAVVRAYTVEAREIADFGRLNDEYLRRSLRLARVQAVSVAAHGAGLRHRRAHRALARAARRSWTSASPWAPSSPSTAISRTSRGRRSRSAGRCRA